MEWYQKLVVSLVPSLVLTSLFLLFPLFLNHITISSPSYNFFFSLPLFLLLTILRNSSLFSLFFVILRYSHYSLFTLSLHLLYSFLFYLRDTDTFPLRHFPQTFVYLIVLISDIFSSLLPSFLPFFPPSLLPSLLHSFLPFPPSLILLILILLLRLAQHLKSLLRLLFLTRDHIDQKIKHITLC